MSNELIAHSVIYDPVSETYLNINFDKHSDIYIGKYRDFTTIETTN